MAAIHGKNYGKPTLDLNFAGNKSLIDTTTGTNYITFTRAQSGNEATYVGSDGLIKYAAADEARFDHDPVTGECLGLLIEESRTNLQPYGSDYSTNYWDFSYGISKTPNATVSPDGTLSATLIQQDTTDSIHQLAGGFGFNSGYITTSSTYTLSLYVKYYNSNKIRLMEQATYGGSTDGSYTKAGVVFNFATESIEKTIQWNSSSQSRIAGYKVDKFPNGWYRLNLSVIPGGDTNNQRVYFGIYPQEGNLSTLQPIPPGAVGIDGQNYSSLTPVTNFVGDGTTGVYIWGAQVEIGSFPTSNIPTTGSTVTRAADVASITGTNFSSWYNQSEGTIYVDFDKATTQRQNPFAISDGTGTNRMSVYYQDDLAVSYIVSSAGGFDQSVYTTSVQLSSKYILGYSSGNTRPAINGNLGTVITESNLPINTTIFFGRRDEGDILYMLTGHISRLTYYPKRLPDIELQQLTK